MSENDHDHDHGSEQSALDAEPRIRAIQSLLLEKGLVSMDAIDEVIAAYEEDIGPMNGARVVARAWTDPAYKDRLLEDANRAVNEFGFAAGGKPLEVVENTDAVHNVIVCTLCSCYPRSLLGLPPTWYKSEAYRSRMVRKPRAVLVEFGLELDEAIDVRVWDQTSEVRHMVLPQRPAGTEDLSEDELADLVDRDSMVGVGRVEPPA